MAGADPGGRGQPVRPGWVSTTWILFLLEMQRALVRPAGTRFGGWRISGALMLALGVYAQYDGLRGGWAAGFSLFGATLLVSAPQIAASYGEERENGTLDQLMAAPVRSHAVFAGKAVALLAQSVALVLVGLGGIWLGSFLPNGVPAGTFLTSAPGLGAGMLAGGALVAAVIMVGLVLSAGSPTAIEAQRRLQALIMAGAAGVIVLSMATLPLLATEEGVRILRPVVRLVRGASAAGPWPWVALAGILLLGLGWIGGVRTRRRRLWP